MDKDDKKFSKEAFLKYQNSKFRNRRRLAMGTAIAYFGMAFYMLFKIAPENFDHYDAFFLQISLVSGTVITAYFGGSSYEEVGIDRSSLVDEFSKLNEHQENMRNRRQANQPDAPPDPGKDDNEVG
jgi:hypothetical protein